MKAIHRNNAVLFIIIAILLCGSIRADYEITSYSIDGGGQTCTGGPYTLTGTLGQPDAGILSGGGYVVSGGFWPGSFGCIVNLTDLMVVADQWLSGGSGFTADLDHNNQVDIADFAQLAYWWYNLCPPNWPIK